MNGITRERHDALGQLMGEVDGMVEERIITERRFWSKVEKSNGCWLWKASKRFKGYGAFAYHEGGKLIQDRAHRYSWRLKNGPIPDRLWVLHKCDTPACVNPDHLFLGTVQDNVTDMMVKGRRVLGGTYGGDYRKGESHHQAKLTTEQVKEIRKLKQGGCSYGQLSKQFGIAIGHAYRVVNGKAWSHVA